MGVVENLKNNGATILMIAHRLHIVTSADQIIYLTVAKYSSGETCGFINKLEKDIGSHESLLENCEGYKNLYSKEQNLVVQLSQQANIYGFQLSDVDRDGNCFFHAVYDQLKRLGINQIHGLPFNGISLRHIAANHIKRNINIYRDSIVGDIDDYLRRLRNNRDWIADDNIVVRALSRELNINIVIIRSDGARPTIFRRENVVSTIYLGYEVGLHYQSIVTTSREIARENIRNVTAVAEIDRVEFQVKDVQRAPSHTAPAAAMFSQVPAMPHNDYPADRPQLR